MGNAWGEGWGWEGVQFLFCKTVPMRVGVSARRVGVGLVVGSEKNGFAKRQKKKRREQRKGTGE